MINRFLFVTIIINVYCCHDKQFLLIIVQMILSLEYYIYLFPLKKKKAKHAYQVKY